MKVFFIDSRRSLKIVIREYDFDMAAKIYFLITNTLSNTENDLDDESVFITYEYLIEGIINCCYSMERIVCLIKKETREISGSLLTEEMTSFRLSSFLMNR